ncbi:exopolysaccharide phosphotransferase SCO6021-like [Ciona intestinalis]
MLKKLVRFRKQVFIVTLVVYGMFLLKVENRCEIGDVDAVYTWVNGSDPKFLASLQLFADHGTNVRSKRFADHDQLKYSLRSLQLFAPWIRNIYIVTNGQVPAWLNTSHPNIIVVKHDSLFTQKEDLPTFSSPAIEVHLHKIPNLSPYFLYFNDDFILGSSVSINDFIAKDCSQKVYFASKIPQDRHLDIEGGEALVSERKFDFEDKTRTEDPYIGSLRFTAHVFHVIYNADVTHQISHMPHLINRHTMKELQSELPSFYHVTSSHRFRQLNDIQFALAYFTYLMVKHDTYGGKIFKHHVMARNLLNINDI